MIRLLMFIFGKSYEDCKSCETLKQQLEYERANNKQLQETLIGILRPTIQEQVPVEVPNVIHSTALFSRRRSALEEQARREAATMKTSKVLAKPDVVNDVPADESVEKLEQELGIAESKG